jgi:hypothetical protein
MHPSMQKVKWSGFIATASILMLLFVMGRQAGSWADDPDSDGRQVSSSPRAVQPLKVFVSSSSAEGVGEAQLTPAVAAALERHVVGGVSEKLRGLARQRGVVGYEPTISSSSVLIETQGRKLVVIKMEIDANSRTVVVAGIDGDTLHRVFCARDSLDEIFLTNGACAEKIQAIHGVRLSG